MSIKVTWDNQEKTVMHFTFDGCWSWDDLNRVNHKARAMLNGVEHKVNVIYDLQRGDWCPKGQYVEPRFLESAVDQHPNYGGETLFVGDTDFTATFASILHKVYPHIDSSKEIFVRSLDKVH